MTTSAIVGGRVVYSRNHLRAFGTQNFEAYVARILWIFYVAKEGPKNEIQKNPRSVFHGEPGNLQCPRNCGMTTTSSLEIGSVPVSQQ